MDVLTTEALSEFARLHDRMRAVIAGIDHGVLHRAPADGENTIAVLVTHTLGSELGWLHRAAGRPFTRDRDAEFHATASAEDLASAIATTASQVTELIGATAAAGLGAPRHLGDGTEVTAAHCVAHALVHAAEHVGHAELTRSLLLRR